MERKVMIKRLGEHLGVKPKYLSVPSFAYEIRTENEIYTIDRHGNITSQDGESTTMEDILTLPRTEEADKLERSCNEESKAAESEEVIKAHEERSAGDAWIDIDNLEVKLDIGDHTGISLKNIINMLYSKQNLIGMAFETNESLMDDSFVKDLDNQSVEDLAGLEAAIKKIGANRCPGFEIDFAKKTFSFWLMGTELTPEKIDAFKDLCASITEYAKTLKRTSFKQAQLDNPKYALRTWLTRIGLNGPEYKEARKTLLKHLEGSGAFRKVGETDEA